MKVDKNTKIYAQLANFIKNIDYDNQILRAYWQKCQKNRGLEGKLTSNKKMNDKANGQNPHFTIRY